MVQLNIIDIGARDGLHPRWSRLQGVDVQAILFEPDPEECDRLKSKYMNRAVVINKALSSKKQIIDFHLCKKGAVSSVFVPNFELLKEYPDVERMEIVQTFSLEADSLDSQLEENGVSDVDFVKLDVQGYELEILQGGVNTLRSCIGLEVEVEFMELYKGQPLFGEVHRFVESELNMTLVDLSKTYYKKSNTLDLFGKGIMAHGDALYLKLPEQAVLLPPQKAIKTMYIYMVYGYYDLARELLVLLRQKRVVDDQFYSVNMESISKHKIRQLPFFRGKDRLRKMFVFLSRLFENKKVFWYGSNTDLGN